MKKTLCAVLALCLCTFPGFISAKTELQKVEAPQNEAKKVAVPDIAKLHPLRKAFYVTNGRDAS